MAVIGRARDPIGRAGVGESTFGAVAVEACQPLAVAFLLPACAGPPATVTDHTVGLLPARRFVYESSKIAERGRGTDIRVERFPYYTERQQ